MRGSTARCVRIIKSVGETDAINRLLRHPVGDFWWGDADYLIEGRHDVGYIEELQAHPALVFNPRRPSDD